MYLFCLVEINYSIQSKSQIFSSFIELKTRISIDLFSAILAKGHCVLDPRIPSSLKGEDFMSFLTDRFLTIIPTDA